jgi:hypothetical protein
MKTMILITLVAACSVNDTKKLAPDGQLGGACYPNNTCDAGFSCEESFCVEGPDAGVVAMDAFYYPCNDDSMFEPNETLATAYNVGGLGSADASMSWGRNYPKLAICPGADKDWFKMEILSAISSLKVEIVYDSPLHGGVALQLGLYAPNQVLIGTGSAGSAYDTLDVTYANPTGDLYVLVNSDGTGEDNYALTLTATP